MLCSMLCMGWQKMAVTPGPMMRVRVSSSKRFNVFRHDHGCCGSTIENAGPFVSPDCQHRVRITVGQVHPRPVQWSNYLVGSWKPVLGPSQPAHCSRLISSLTAGAFRSPSIPSLHSKGKPQPMLDLITGGALGLPTPFSGNNGIDRRACRRKQCTGECAGLVPSGCRGRVPSRSTRRRSCQ